MYIAPAPEDHSDRFYQCLDAGTIAFILATVAYTGVKALPWLPVQFGYRLWLPPAKK